MANNPETTVTFKVFNQDFKKAMKEMSNENATLRNEFLLQQERMKGTASATDNLRASITYLTNSQQIVNRQAQETRQQLERARALYGENSQEAATLTRQLGQVELHEARLENRIREANESLANQATAADRAADSISKAGGKMKEVGTTMSSSVTPAILGVGVAAGLVASEVEDSTSKIKNSLGLTAESAEELSAVSRDIYNRGFGESLAEVDEALIRTKQNIKGLNDTELSDVIVQAQVLADTFDSDVNEVTRAANNVMQGFGVSSEEAFDLMAYGAQNGLNFSNEMFDNLSEYAPLFGKMGFSADEYFQLLEKGSSAGAYNLDYINDIMKETQIRLKDGSKSTAEAMSQLSEGTQQTWKDFLVGKSTVKDVHNDVIADLKSMDDQTAANNIGVALYGTKWEDLETEAVYALGGIDGELGKVDGSMDEMVKTQEETFGQRFQSMIRELKSSLLPLGQVLLDMAVNWLPRISDAVQILSTWFGNLSPSIQSLIVVFGGVLAVVGPLLVTLGFMAQGIGALIGVLAGVSTPVILVVAAIGLLVAGLIAAYTQSEQFRDKVNTVFNVIKDVAMQAFGIMASFIGEKVQQIKQFWDENGSQILQAVDNCFSGIMNVIKFIMPAVLFIIESVWISIKGVIDGVLKIIMGLIKTFVGVFTGDFSKMWEGIKQIFSGAIQLVWNLVNLMLFGKLLTGAKALVTGFVNSIKSLATGSQASFKAMVDAIIRFFTDFASKISTGASNMVKGFVNYIKSMSDQALRIFGILRSSGSSVISSLFTTIRSVAGNIFSTVKSNFNNAKTAGVNAIKGLYTGITGAFGNILSKASSIASNLVSKFRGISLVQIGRDIINGLVSGIGSMAGKIQEKVQSLASKIPGWAKKILGIQSPSRVMAAEVGEHVPTGIAMGIDSTSYKAEEAAINVAKDVVSASKKAFDDSMDGTDFEFESGLTNSIGRVKNVVAKATAKLAEYTMPSLNSTVSLSHKNILDGMELTLPKQQPINLSIVSELDGYEVAKNQLQYVDGMLYNSGQSRLIAKGVK